MMLVTLRYATRARIQIETIGDFFASIGASDAGTLVLRRIKNTAEQLVEFPDLGRTGAATGTHELVVKGLPYVIVYEKYPEDSFQIMILNVWHCAQER